MIVTEEDYNEMHYQLRQEIDLLNEKLLESNRKCDKIMDAYVELSQITLGLKSQDELPVFPPNKPRPVIDQPISLFAFGYLEVMIGIFLAAAVVGFFVYLKP